MAKVECHNCGKKGHIAKDCYTEPWSGKTSLICHSCGGWGHPARLCAESDLPGATRKGGQRLHGGIAKNIDRLKQLHAPYERSAPASGCGMHNALVATCARLPPAVRNRRLHPKRQRSTKEPLAHLLWALKKPFADYFGCHGFATCL